MQHRSNNDQFNGISAKEKEQILSNGVLSEVARTIGVNRSTVSRVFNGLIKNPDPVVFQALADGISAFLNRKEVCVACGQTLPPRKD